MVVVIKIGRRIHRSDSDKNWFINKVSNLKNTLSIQQYMWKTILYGIMLSTKKMDKAIKKNLNNPDFKFKYMKKKYIEEESLNYNIEWLELLLFGNEDEELEEYTSAMKFFDKIGNNRLFRQRAGKVEIDPELSAPYQHKLKSRNSERLISKGFDKVKDVTIAKALNDVGIIVIIKPPVKGELELLHGESKTPRVNLEENEELELLKARLENIKKIVILLVIYILSLIILCSYLFSLYVASIK